MRTITLLVVFLSLALPCLPDLVEASDSAPRAIQGRCPSPVLYAHGRYPMRAPFDKDFFAIAHGPATLDFEYEERVNAAHFRCLTRALKEARALQYVYPYTGEYTPRIHSEPAVLMQSALTMLYPARGVEQRPTEAAEFAAQAYTAYMRGFDAKEAWFSRKEAELATKAQQEEARYRHSKKMALATSIAAYFIYDKYLEAPPDVTLEAVVAPFESASRDRAQRRSRLAADADQLEKQIASHTTGGWSSDGVRLNIIRFEHPAYSYHRQDHTRYLVRVRANTSSCTGVIVQRQLVLTAQHCLYNADGTMKGPPYTASLEYLLHTAETGTSPTSVTARIERWWTPQALWTEDWRNDYAFLRIDQDLGGGSWAPVYLEPLANLQSSKVTVAGYSSDIDGGEFITMDWGCAFEAPQEGLIAHKCKTWQGASGAAIIASEGPYKGWVVGVHAYGYGPDAASGGGGGPSPRQLPFLRDFTAALEGLRDKNN